MGSTRAITPLMAPKTPSPAHSQELDSSAAVMGYAAVKYADLKNGRLTSYKFSFDEMLNLKGNTAVYLLYAHARIVSVARRSGRNMAGRRPVSHAEIQMPQTLHQCARQRQCILRMLQDSQRRFLLALAV